MRDEGTKKLFMRVDGGYIAIILFATYDHHNRPQLPFCKLQCPKMKGYRR